MTYALTVILLLLGLAPNYVASQYCCSTTNTLLAVGNANTAAIAANTAGGGGGGEGACGACSYSSQTLTSLVLATDWGNFSQAQWMNFLVAVTRDTSYVVPTTVSTAGLDAANMTLAQALTIIAKGLITKIGSNWIPIGVDPVGGLTLGQLFVSANYPTGLSTNTPFLQTIAYGITDANGELGDINAALTDPVSLLTQAQMTARGLFPGNAASTTPFLQDIKNQLNGPGPVSVGTSTYNTNLNVQAGNALLGTIQTDTENTVLSLQSINGTSVLGTMIDNFVNSYYYWSSNIATALRDPLGGLSVGQFAASTYNLLAAANFPSAVVTNVPYLSTISTNTLATYNAMRNSVTNFPYLSGLVTTNTSTTITQVLTNLYGGAMYWLEQVNINTQGNTEAIVNSLALGLWLGGSGNASVATWTWKTYSALLPANGTTANTLGSMIANLYGGTMYWLEQIATSVSPYLSSVPPAGWLTGRFIMNGFLCALDTPLSSCTEIITYQPSSATTSGNIQFKKITGMKIGATSERFLLGLAAYASDGGAFTTRGSTTFSPVAPSAFSQDGSSQVIYPQHLRTLAAGPSFESSIPSISDIAPTYFAVEVNFNPDVGGSLLNEAITPNNFSCAPNELFLNVSISYITPVLGFAQPGVTWVELAVLADYTDVGGYQLRTWSQTIAVANYASVAAFQYACQTGADYPTISTRPLLCYVPVCIPPEAFSLQPVLRWLAATQDTGDFELFYLWPTPNYPPSPYPLQTLGSSRQVPSWVPSNQGLVGFTSETFWNQIPSSPAFMTPTKQPVLTEWYLCHISTSQVLAHVTVQLGGGRATSQADQQIGYTELQSEWFQTVLDKDYQRSFGDYYLSQIAAFNAGSNNGFYLAGEWDNSCFLPSSLGNLYVPLQITSVYMDAVFINI